MSRVIWISLPAGWDLQTTTEAREKKRERGIIMYLMGIAFGVILIFYTIFPLNILDGTAKRYNKIPNWLSVRPFFIAFAGVGIVLYNFLCIMHKIQQIQ